MVLKKGNSVASSFSIESKDYLFKFVFFVYFALLISLSCAKASNPIDEKSLVALAIPSPSSTSFTNENSSPTQMPPSGGIAPPGQPENPPILNDIHLQLADAPTAIDPNKLDASIVVDGITFQLPVHNKTAVTAFIGKRDMYRSADGVVHNISYSYSTTPEIFGADIWFRFFSRADQKFKIIVVASNAYGSSMKEADYSHNRACVGVAMVPVIYGDCNNFCLEGRIVGGRVEFAAKFKHGPLEVLDISASGFRPITGYPINYGESLTFPDPIPAGDTQAKLSFQLTDTEANYTCLQVKGDAFFTDANGFQSLTEFRMFRIE